MRRFAANLQYNEKTSKLKEVLYKGEGSVDFYKVILVDDEEDVRVSIERKLDWNSLGFEIVGSVSNGEEALELTEHKHVDVVMTDIKMPFMDGLTLCAKVKENYKNTKVVLYSGFDNFEFAREAIHLEAEEYLLKPIGAKDLENVFRKIKQNLDKEFDERRNLKTLNDYYQKSLPMMREHVLAGMLEGKITESQAEALIKSYGMGFSAPYYCVALLAGDSFMGGKEFQTGQMLMLSLKNLTEEYLENNIKSHTFMYLGCVVVIAQLQSTKEIHQFIYHMNQVCRMGARMMDMNVNAGVGNIYSQLSQIAISYEEAKTAVDYRAFEDASGQAIYINDVEPKAQEVIFRELQGISKIIHEIKFGTQEELRHSIAEFILELKEYKATAQLYQLVFMEVVTELLKLLRSYQLDMTEVFGKNFVPYQEVAKFHSLDEFSVTLEEKCSQIWNMIRKKRTHSTIAMTEKAKNYIEEHYGESNLSVEQLCNYLNVSATYFSILFKKEVGMSFISYLTKVRLEHAVELLNNTEDKSYMIAEKVGYTEPNYFSYVFKKQYGVSPSKYRTNKEK